MKILLPTLLTASLITTGLGFNSLATASDDEYRGKHHERHHNGHHCDYHKGGHGHHAWIKDLSDEQRTKLDALHVDYKKQKYTLKHKVKDAKTALMKEVTTDKPDQNAINKQIDKILKLKREKLLLKVAHKIDVRKLLNTDQKKQFDEHVMNKVTSCKKGKRHHH